MDDLQLVSRRLIMTNLAVELVLLPFAIVGAAALFAPKAIEGWRANADEPSIPEVIPEICPLEHPAQCEAVERDASLRIALASEQGWCDEIGWILVGPDGRFASQPNLREKRLAVSCALGDDRTIIRSFRFVDETTVISVSDGEEPSPSITTASSR